MMRTALVFLALAVACCLFGVARAHEKHSNQTEGWLFKKKKVILLGFNGDGKTSYKLDVEALTRGLGNSMESHTPTCIETKERLPLQYDISFEVSHATAEHERAFEVALSKNLKFVGQKAESHFVYDVDIDNIEPTFTQISRDIRSDKKTVAPNVVIIVNPELTRVEAPSSPEGYHPNAITYRYRQNNGVYTQTWVSNDRFVVIDTGSGPVEYGVTNAGEGTVSLESIPSVADMEERARDKKGDLDFTQKDLGKHLRFMSQLSSLVISAVRYVFLPDMHFKHLPQAERIVVPIIVLRNHRRFNPLVEGSIDTLPEGVQGPVNEFNIDMPAIRRELSKMLLPHQELILTTGVHSLHDHKQVAVAVMKAMKGDSVHSASPNGKYLASTSTYLDSDVLLHEFARIGDELVAGLLARSQSNSDLLSRSELPGQEAEAGTGAKAAGHKIVPVFVLSLLGMPSEMLLDRTKLHVSSPNCVIALQTGASPIALPFFYEDGVVRVSPRSPTRHIVAGLAQTIGGVTPPFSRYSPQNKAMVSDYMWATGHHPFGPFSTTPVLSRVFLDHIARNNIVSRISVAYELVHEATTHLEEFTAEYVLDPLGEHVEYIEHSTSFLPEGLLTFSEKEASKMPLARDIVLRLGNELLKIEKMFSRLANHMMHYNFNEANRLSASILMTAGAFATYTRDEVNRAHEELMCCTKQHKVGAKAETSRPIGLIVFALLAVVGVVYQLTKVFGRMQGRGSRRPFGFSSGVRSDKRY